MPVTLRDTIVGLLRETGYHPDFAAQAQEQARRLVEVLVRENNERTVDVARLAREGNLRAARARQLSYDALLMGDYFDARVRFLEQVVLNVSELRSPVRVADDGCGSGVDIYCLRHILPEEVTLIGIDPNETALTEARRRNEGITFYPSLNGQNFDAIYSDFFDVGSNLLHEVAEKGREYVRALHSGGMLLQNVDQTDAGRRLLINVMSGMELVREELLARIAGGPDCYLLVWRKREIRHQGPLSDEQERDS